MSILQHELNCHSCTGLPSAEGRDCRQCYFSQTAAVQDSFFENAVQPYAWFAALLLFLSYIIGLWFTLRTHAALIWATEMEEKKAAQAAQAAQTAQAGQAAPDSFAYEPRHLLFPNGAPEASGAATGAATGAKDSIRESPLYKRILGQSLKHYGLDDGNASGSWEQTESGCSTSTDPKGNIPHLVPPRTAGNDGCPVPKAIRGLTGEDNERLVRQVTEVAATAAAVAARDAARSRKFPGQQTAGRTAGRALADQVKPLGDEPDASGIAVDPTAHAAAGGGHDAPNWSKAKSSIILLGATILYALVAEILVNTVDVVLESVEIDEKFLGITLFALVPNTTEFLVCTSSCFLPGPGLPLSSD